MAFFRRNPPLWVQIVTSQEEEVRFGKFVEQFLAWKPEEEPEEDEEEEKPAA